MRSKGWIVFASLATIAFTLAMAYFVWQTENAVRLLDRVVALQEGTSVEVRASLARTEGQIREITKNIRLPSVPEWMRAIEAPLKDRTERLLKDAQREGFQEALSLWSQRRWGEEDARWKALVETMRKDQETARKRYEQGEERWQILVEMLREQQENVEKQTERAEEQWKELMATLRKDREAAQKQYAETVQRLNEERAQALERARQLEQERDQEIGKLLEQARKIDQERKRQLAEFCEKRPESVVCRDL